MIKLFLSAILLPLRTVEALERIASASERLAAAFEEAALDMLPGSFVGGDPMAPIRFPEDLWPGDETENAPVEPNIDYSAVRDYVHGDEDEED